MQAKQLSFESGFAVVAGNTRSQAAVMVIEHGNRKADRRISIAAAINGYMYPKEKALLRLTASNAHSNRAC